MPLYEYRCTNCNHLFEVFHEVGGQPGPCPNCGTTSAHRVFTSVGLIFKGSGFHTTDYRRRSTPDGESTKDSPGQDHSTKSGKGTEAITKSDS